MAFFETLGILDGIIVLLTLAALVFVSVRFGGKAKSSDEYNNAGKSLNIWVVVGSTIATFMGAYSGLGSPQLIFSGGLSGLTVALMWNVGWAFQCLMAKPLRASGADTLPEFISIKYDKSTRTISSVVTVVYIFSQIAGQFIACGTMAEILGIGTFEQGIIFGGLIITVLTLFGGLEGVAVTNTIQSVFIVIVCVVAVPLVSFFKAGGLDTVFANIQQVSPEKLSMLAGIGPMTLIGYILSNALASGAEPAYAQRILAAKDVKTGVKGSIVSNIVGACLTIPISLGVLCLPYILPEITDGSHYIPAMILNIFPPVVKGLAVFAFMSLFLTTGAAFLLLTSSVVTNDIIKPLRPNMEDGKLLKISRLLVVAIGIISIVIAVAGDSIYSVMLLGSACYGAAVFFPLLVACLFKNKRCNYKLVNAGMLCGCFVTLIWNWTLTSVTGVEGVVVGGICCLVLCLVGLRTVDNTADRLKV